MAALATGRGEWPVIINAECPPALFIDCYEDRIDRFRRPLVVLLMAVLLLSGFLTAVTESTSALQGDSLSFQQRADVMTAIDVGTNVFASGDPSLIDHFVTDDTKVAYPSGSAIGPEAALHLSSIIDGGVDGRAFSVDFARIEGDTVILNWVLSGPIAPGALIWYSVPEGSSIAGELEFVVVDGQVTDMALSVVS